MYKYTCNRIVGRWTDTDIQKKEICVCVRMLYYLFLSDNIQNRSKIIKDTHHDCLYVITRKQTAKNTEKVHQTAVFLYSFYQRVFGHTCVWWFRVSCIVWFTFYLRPCVRSLNSITTLLQWVFHSFIELIDVKSSFVWE